MFLVYELNLRMIDGKPITQELLEGLSSRCENNWAEDEAEMNQQRNDVPPVSLYEYT